MFENSQLKAAQLNISQIIRPLGFSEFMRVTNRVSVSDLFGSGKIPGLYVLAFQDGAFYAGKTNDIKTRYVSHQKNHGDIDYLAFKDLPVHKQDEEEKPLIQKLKTEGFLLRNIQFISYPDISREFDEIISPEDQEAWLDGGFLADRQVRNEEAEQRYRYTKKFQSLKKEPEFSEIENFLRHYTSVGLPKPKLTERCYWCVTVWPSPSSYVNKQTKREYVRINIGGCEVLTIGKDCVFPGCKQGIFLAFHVSRSCLEDKATKAETYIRENFPSVVISDHKYVAMGEDQILLIVSGFENAEKFINDPKVMKSIRLGNVGLMRKRSCLYSQNHCYDMADLMVEGIIQQSAYKYVTLLTASSA